MPLKRLASVAVAALLATGAVHVQTSLAQAGAKAPPPAATAAPASPPTLGSTAGIAKPGAGAKLNLNAANAAQLDELPGVGKARANAILTERAKGPFKDWNDFDARTAHSSVNAGVKAKMKDLVTF